MGPVVLLNNEKTTVTVNNLEASPLQLQKVLRCLTDLLPSAHYKPKAIMVKQGQGGVDTYQFRIDVGGPASIDSQKIRAALLNTGAKGFFIEVPVPKVR